MTDPKIIILSPHPWTSWPIARDESLFASGKLMSMRRSEVRTANRYILVRILSSHWGLCLKGVIGIYSRKVRGANLTVTVPYSGSSCHQAYYCQPGRLLKMQATCTLCSMSLLDAVSIGNFSELNDVCSSMVRSSSLEISRGRQISSIAHKEATICGTSVTVRTRDTPNFNSNGSCSN